MLDEMNSRIVIQRLKADGWYVVRQVGSHKQFKHPTKLGTVTVGPSEPRHPVEDVAKHRTAERLETRMSMNPYIALINKDPDSDFGVSFPDLPGCVTAGSTLEEARLFASEALALHLEALADDGERAPSPSTFEAIMSDPINRDALAVLIHAPEAARAG